MTFGEVIVGERSITSRDLNVNDMSVIQFDVRNFINSCFLYCSAKVCWYGHVCVPAYIMFYFCMFFAAAQLASKVE